jgi:hypothetical protein
LGLGPWPFRIGPTHRVVTICGQPLVQRRSPDASQPLAGGLASGPNRSPVQ